jgi:hypothetical protein
MPSIVQIRINLNAIGCMMKHLKLFEAIGLALILVAWGLEWNSYKKYESAISSFVERFNTMQNAYIAKQQLAEIGFNSAMTRAIIISDPKKMNLLIVNNMHSEAWKSEEVRSRWLQKIINNIFEFDLYIKHFEKFNTQYKFGFEEKIRKYHEEFNDIKRPLAKLGNIDPHAVLSISEKFTVVDALGVERLFDPLSEMNMEFLTDIISELNKRKTKRLFIYELMYIFGSMSLITPKILEWIIGLKKKQPEKFPRKK